MKKQLLLVLWIPMCCTAEPSTGSNAIRLGSLEFDLVEISQPQNDTVQHYSDQHYAVFYCIPSSINSGGTIVGKCSTAAGGIVGYLYNNGQYTYNLGPAPVCDEGSSYAGFTASGIYDVNDNGRFLLYQMINCYDILWGTRGQYRSYILGHGTTQLTIPENSNYAVPSGMNNMGQAIGSGFIWPPGTPYNVSFNLDSNSYTLATDINDSGDVIGTKYAINDGKSSRPRTVGFISTHSGDHIEITYPDYQYDDLQVVEAFHINRDGTVVGWYLQPGSYSWNGFMYKQGVFYPMGSPYPHTFVVGIADDGTMVGIGSTLSSSYNYSANTFVYYPHLDSDGDGLLNSWESRGLTLSDGRYLNLPAMGARWDHVDLFVEVDHMKGGDHSHEFKQDAMEQVIAAFGNAPVGNPDGTTGINIHIDAGPDSIMDKPTLTKWGQHSAANSIAETKPLQQLGNWVVDKTTGKEIYDWADFEELKSDNFDKELRGKVFHYTIFAHSQGTHPSWSGVAQIPGSNFIVSLGGGNWTETSIEQAGTFTHEFGHNLGLHHGGGPGLANWKPNYLSVMNYLYQVTGLTLDHNDGVLDYSRYDSRSILDIDENNLDENRGVTATGEAMRYGVFWLCAANTLSGTIADVNSPADWNCNGVASDTGYARDITFDKKTSRLSSIEDWSKLTYSFAGGDIGAGSNNLAVLQIEEAELDAETAALMPRLYGIDIRDIPFRKAVPGETIVYTFSAKNIGQNDDEYNVEIRSNQGWSRTDNVPAVVRLKSGESTEINVTTVVPVGAVPGVTDKLELVLRSRRNPRIGDSGLVETTVTLNGRAALPPLCRGKAVTITGGNGADVINGTPGDDVIWSGNGNDSIWGHGGNDVICGGNGDDLIEAGDGNDEVEGELGADVVKGGDGNDLLMGGEGADTLDGGKAQDTCVGGKGENVLLSCEKDRL